ncbi:hypothetical protein FKM82_023816 [Ascaphus truei]
MFSRLLRPPSARGPALWLAVARDTEEAGDGGERRRGGREVYSRATERSRELLRRIKDEVGSPGVVVGVSVDGEAVWTEGLGFADVENRVPCTAETVMRVASISKSFTMAAIAKLWEDGRLNLDLPVQEYVPEFPEKEFEGEKVTVTTRLLVSHLSGIRHYEKDVQKTRNKVAKKGSEPAAPEAANRPPVAADEQESAVSKAESGGKEPKSRGARKRSPAEPEEFYIKEKFETVIESLELFKNDPLVFKPGSQFLYSTHAWTLLSAVVERASGQTFLEHMLKMFRELGMRSTLPEEHEPIIYNRARFYTFNDKKRLVNTPYVDNSFKWAGGCFVSTVGDLLTFGNVLLYSYQARGTSQLLPGYLKPDTISMVWRPVPNTKMVWDKDGKYAMGWATVESKQACGQCQHLRHYVSHIGEAVGASSVLLILPEQENPSTLNNKMASAPRGVVVTIISNMQAIDLNSTALKLALEFEKDKSRR